MTLKQRVRGKSKKEKNDQKSEDSLDRIEEQRNKNKNTQSIHRDNMTIVKNQSIDKRGKGR